MTSASRWIILLDLADTPVIRNKIRRIQSDALRHAASVARWSSSTTKASDEMRQQAIDLIKSEESTIKT
jgi:hypothetical protein